MTATAGHAYAPDGRLQQMKLGNNLWETRDYQTPGTTTRFKLVTPDELTMLPGAIERVALSYHYSGTANNGNLMSHTITRPGRTQPWTQTFTYDAANRLETARETGGYDREFGYDRYGNRWVKPHPVKLNNGMTQTDMHEPKYATQFDAAKNQLASPPMVDYYDAAGNQTMYSPYTLAYDAENRLKSMTHTTQRVRQRICTMGQAVGCEKTWTPGGGTAEDTYYVYDIVGQPGGRVWDRIGFKPAAIGHPLSRSPTYWAASGPSPTPPAPSSSATITCHSDGCSVPRTTDALTRAATRPTPRRVARQQDVSQKFTGQLRDEETRLDYFGARYMSGPEGRFLSPDPSRLSAFFTDPQSWNGYSYAYNQPFRFVDRNGAWPTRIHNRIIESAFEHRLSPSQRAILKNASRNQDSFDSIFTTQTNYQHATRAPGQSVLEARTAFLDFVSEHLTRAANLQTAFWQQGNSGYSDAALNSFGIALHAITDAPSPAHVFFQPWDLSKFTPGRLFRSGGHWLRENMPFTYAGNVKADLDMTAQASFDAVFGQPFSRSDMLAFLNMLNDNTEPRNQSELVTVCIVFESECLPN